MQKVVLISLLLILSVNSYDYFLSSPEQNFNLGSNQATCISMASDQSQVIVGFQNGLIEAYNMQGKYLYNVTLHTRSILSIQWFNTGGFLALDSSGYLTLNYNNGTLALNYTFPATGNTLLGMTFSVLNNIETIYLGLIYSTNIIQYSVSIPNQTAGITRTYTVNNVVTATYTANHETLIVGTSQSQIIIYNCTNGNQIGNTTTLNGNANVVSFLPYGNGNTYLLLDNQSQFFQFNADTAQFSGTGFQMTKTGSVAAVCPSNLYVIFGYSSQAVLVTFQYGQTVGQQLSYMKNNARAIQCGQNNLITLDASNYLAFNSYDIVDSKILGWVIAVIVICCVLFIALVVTIIYCVCKRRKRQLLLNNTDYAKELNSSRR